MSAPIVPATGGGLAEALNILLDKGLVIDATIRVTVIGIELLTIEVRIVLASVDTYIRYLEAMQRLEVQRRALNSGTSPVPAPVPAFASQGLAGTYGLLTTPMPVSTPVPPAASAIPTGQDEP
ncbi:gas vesicle protein GvpJ [Amycolatopsis sp. YIM 10]|uniref:gas vesicle protein GvpJ n=1 Tax=Amycolatopsis sp. YIM 10 TaxID=2653857 RepID=UPI0012A92E8A|nr:gas vesicle protein GvpJ [Amycolatopsis sp. YIM 10]QFU91180.1 Gas vesicle structural protein [Amycolatopsis sp. YIM 10]